MQPSVTATQPLALSQIPPTVVQLGRELVRSRLLLAYVLSGLVVGSLTSPFPRALVNYALAAIYVLVIYIWTRGDETIVAEESREREANRRRDFLLVALLTAANFAGTSLFWATPTLRKIMTDLGRQLLSLGWNAELAGMVGNAVVSSAITLIPAIALAVLLGLRTQRMGLVPRRLGLALVLIAIGVGIAGLVKLGFGQSTRLWSGSVEIPLVLALFGAQMFINGFPEEFLFRGLMLPRLVRWVGNPRNALVVTSILFTFSHVPSHLAQPAGMPWWLIVFAPLVSPGPQPTGLIWGYLFYRTRSIWPGVLWHTSFMTLGVLFL